MFSFGIAVAVSLVVTLLLLRFSSTHRHLSFDHDVDGVRRLHGHPVPRIGGIAVAMAAWVGALLIYLRDAYTGAGMLLVLISALPAFLGGVAEDLTKCVRPRWRMGFMAASCLLAYLLYHLMITRVDIPWLDPMMRMTLIALPLTWLALLTITNAMNIIDGLHGLAGVTASIMFGGIALVAFRVGDALVVSASLLMAGSILGFLFWNYPRGHIFLGDGGAYFLGFMLGTMSILVVIRNPGVSAWFPVLLLAYPLVEVSFSVYRRRILKGRNPGLPDAVHLHQLVYRRVVRWAVGQSEPSLKTRRNAMTAPYLWVLSSLAVAPAVMFYDQTVVLACGFAVFYASYIWLYFRIVRMRVPRWMILRRARRQRHEHRRDR